MSKEKQIDYKEYAKQMRENAARSYNGTEPVVICSAELWEEIATIIENSRKQSEGEWTKHLDEWDCEYAKCSCCGEEFYDANGEDTIDMFYNFCPNCGAKMKGESND